MEIKNGQPGHTSCRHTSLTNSVTSVCTAKGFHWNQQSDIVHMRCRAATCNANFVLLKFVRPASEIKGQISASSTFGRLDQLFVWKGFIYQTLPVFSCVVLKVVSFFLCTPALITSWNFQIENEFTGCCFGYWTCNTTTGSEEMRS